MESKQFKYKVDCDLLWLCLNTEFSIIVNNPLQLLIGGHGTYPKTKWPLCLVLRVSTSGGLDCFF